MADMDYQFLYRPLIRLRNGKRIYASKYGLKAFRIKIRREPPKQYRLPGID